MTLLLVIIYYSRNAKGPIFSAHMWESVMRRTEHPIRAKRKNVNLRAHVWAHSISIHHFLKWCCWSEKFIVFAKLCIRNAYLMLKNYSYKCSKTEWKIYERLKRRTLADKLIIIVITIFDQINVLYIYHKIVIFAMNI